MKKIVVLLCIVFFSTLMGVELLQASTHTENIRIRINGEYLPIPTYDQHPIIFAQHNAILVPARAIMETLGYTVTWHPYTQSASFANERGITFVQVGNANVITTYGESISVRSPSQLIVNRILICLRTVYAITGMHSQWDWPGNAIDIFECESLRPTLTMRPESYVGVTTYGNPNSIPFTSSPADVVQFLDDFGFDITTVRPLYAPGIVPYPSRVDDGRTWQDYDGTFFYKANGVLVHFETEQQMYFIHSHTDRVQTTLGAGVGDHLEHILDVYGFTFMMNPFSGNIFDGYVGCIEYFDGVHYLSFTFDNNGYVTSWRIGTSSNFFLSPFRNDFGDMPLHFLLPTRYL